MEWCTSLTSQQPPLSVWKVISNIGDNKFYSLGDIFSSSRYTFPPNTCTIVYDTKYLLPPIGIKLVYILIDTSDTLPLYIYELIPPIGYISLGIVASVSQSIDISLYRCVPIIHTIQSSINTNTLYTQPINDIKDITHDQVSKITNIHTLDVLEGKLHQVLHIQRKLLKLLRVDKHIKNSKSDNPTIPTIPTPTSTSVDNSTINTNNIMKKEISNITKNILDNTKLLNETITNVLPTSKSFPTEEQLLSNLSKEALEDNDTSINQQTVQLTRLENRNLRHALYGYHLLYKEIKNYITKWDERNAIKIFTKDTKLNNNDDISLLSPSNILQHIHLLLHSGERLPCQEELLRSIIGIELDISIDDNTIYGLRHINNIMNNLKRPKCIWYEKPNDVQMQSSYYATMNI